jgi:hypothetical protein
MVTTDGAYVSGAYRGMGWAGHQLIMFRVQLKSCVRVENTDGVDTGVVRPVPPSISACRSDVQSKMSIKFTRVDLCGVAEGGALGSHVGNGTRSWVELQMRNL